MTARRARRGFALLVALLAITLTGALLTAVAFRAGELGHVARVTTLRELAFADAEGALWEGAASADAGALRTLPVGGSTTIGTTFSGTRVVAVRTDSTIYWLVATAQRQRGRDVARQRVALSATLPHDTAITHLRPVADRAWVALY